MELLGKPAPGRPLLVMAVPQEARALDTSLPVLLTGMGKVNAAAALARTLGRGPTPSLLVNLGTAGALRGGQRGLHTIGTVIQHDLDTEFLRALTGVSYGPPLTLAHGAAGATVLASGDAFIADPATRDALAKRADLVDMEGYALATAAAAAGVPITMVKHVSDEADEQAVTSWRDSVAASARALAAWAAANVPGY